MRSPDELTQIFRARGLKVTPQRQSIFLALHGSTVHPTAEAVYAVVRSEMPTISLRTVYQTLNDLADMGEIKALELGTGASRFDPHSGPHHHLVCERCGKVQDLETEFPGVTVPAGDDFGFEVTSTEIVFRGRCRTCVAVAPGDDADESRPHPTNQPSRHGGNRCLTSRAPRRKRT